MKKLILLSGLLLGSLAEAKTFQFGGYTFDDSLSPDIIERKGNGERLATMQLTKGLPSEAPRSVLGEEGFGVGFDVSKTFGYALQESAAALTLPKPKEDDEVGHLKHAISLRWSSNQRIANSDGPELLFFEQGTYEGGPEAFMFRVQKQSGSWSAWFFKSPAKFQDVDGSRGYFLTEVDLSLIGVEDGEAITEIQVANMTILDRINRNTALAVFGIVIPNQSAPSARYARPATL